MNSRLKKCVLFIVLTLFLIGVFNHFSYAQTETPTPTITPTPTPDTSSQDRQNQLQKEIEELQKKLSELQGQEKTLSSQIAVMDSQIKLTQLRINAVKQQIKDLTDDIETATKKISNLEESLSTLTKVLLNRIVATYEVGNVGPLHVLLASNNISSFFTRANYLRLAQAHDKKLIFETQQAKNDYTNQKEIFEGKKEKIEALKKQLEVYSAELDQEKKEKQALLTITKNDEAIYQQKLQAALAEQRAIQQITAGLGNVAFAGKVKEGDTIGQMVIGRSACSSGTHLHFEVQKNGAIEDPSNYLSNKSVTFENSPDSQFSFSGGWNWPLSDPILIEQGYGMTYWARSGWYGGSPHTGIDMYSNSSMAVRAVKDGDLYKGNIACGGGTLLFARVDQSDGIQTYYLHIIP